MLRTETRPTDMLRCIELTAAAEHALRLDPSGYISAQLLDFRDVIWSQIAPGWTWDGRRWDGSQWVAA